MRGVILARLMRAWAGRIDVLGAEGAIDKLSSIRDRAGAVPLLYFHWTIDEFPRLVVAQRFPEALGPDVSYVTDDTIGGRLGRDVLNWLGYRTLAFRVSHPAYRVADLKRILAAPGSVSISADGRGPYGAVHSGLPQLAIRKNAIAVPVSVVSSSAVYFGRPGPMAVPHLGAKVAISIGEPISPESIKDGGPGVLQGALMKARLAGLSILWAQRSS